MEPTSLHFRTIHLQGKHFVIHNLIGPSFKVLWKSPILESICEIHLESVGGWAETSVVESLVSMEQASLANLLVNVVDENTEMYHFHVIRYGVVAHFNTTNVLRLVAWIRSQSAGLVPIHLHTFQRIRLV